MEGGPTFTQLYTLYENVHLIRKKEMKFEASLHGVKLKFKESSEDNTFKDKSGVAQQLPMFGDPSVYEGMTQEQREFETQRMMGLHKDWAHGRKDLKE